MKHLIGMHVVEARELVHFEGYDLVSLTGNPRRDHYPIRPTIEVTLDKGCLIEAVLSEPKREST